MKKIVASLIVFELLLSLIVMIRPAVSGATRVIVDPSITEYYDNAVGQQFTVSIKIADVMNLYGFDIVLQWNTTFLAYVSHSVRVPRDTYSDGVLWNPVWPLEDQVNATTGTYWIAFACGWPAPSFNGSGTVFTMTFQIISQPVQPQPDANITLHLYSSTSSSPDLSNPIGQPIPHSTEDGTVLLHALSGVLHDVAVTDIKSSKTVIGQGYRGNITVTAENHGGLTETFNVTVYANTTTLQTQTLSLTGGASADITFTWDTTSFAYGNYTIRAYAWPITGEANTTNNNCTDGLVHVGFPGNVNYFDGSRKVDMIDLWLIQGKFGGIIGDPRYVPNYDVDNGGKIDMIDLWITQKHFGQIEP